MKSPVSIIVPYFNSLESIGRLIDSVKIQSHHDFQCILVDDGSFDGSFEYVNECVYGDTRFLNMKRPAGYKPGGRGAKNYGFSVITFPYTVFFDSDDVMYEGYLEERVRFLNDNNGKDAVVSDFGWRVTPGQVKRVYRYNRRLFDDFKENARKDWFWLHYMDYRFWFNPGNPMWRTSSIKDKPMWDETTSIGEDHEYHARLMLSGLDIGIIDGVHWDYMANPGSMISTSESVSPLLSRSHGKMLVLEYILKHLGNRTVLVRKELTWQVKLLRRIMMCKTDEKEIEDSIGIMVERIDHLMDLIGYSAIRKSMFRAGLKAILAFHQETGSGHRLYSLLAPDRMKTEENSLFSIL